MIQQDNFLQAMQYILYHERVTFMWEEVKTSEKEWKVSPTVYVEGACDMAVFAICQIFGRYGNLNKKMVGIPYSSYQTVTVNYNFR